MRIFKTKGVGRYARRERISDASLREAIERAERGVIDADLGGGLIKQRVARPGQGRSGGYRTIIAYREAGRAVFLYVFAKSERDNIEPDELQDLQDLGARWLGLTDRDLDAHVEDGALQEVRDDDDQDA